MDDQYGAQNAGLMGLGGAVKGALQGWQDAEDRQQKRLEMTAKLEAMKQAKDRAQLQEQMDLREKNLQKDPVSGGLIDAPTTARQRDQAQLGGKEKGIGITYDENGRMHSDYDENSPQMIAARAKETRADQYGRPAQVGPKDWAKLSDALDPNRARGGNLAATQKLINSADRIHGIFQQFPDGNVPKAQATELATAVAGLYSGGSPQSQHQIDQIVPSSLQGRAADIASWVTGNPMGKEQQAFIAILKESSERERAIAIRQKMDAQRARLPAFEHLRAADPQHYERMLKSYGVTEFDDPNAQPAYTPSPQGGLIQQESPGLLSKLGGLLGFGGKKSAPAQQKPPTIMQNGHVYNLNPQTGEYQ